MAARPVAAGSISFGLVSIPVKLYTATRPKSVSFNLLHAKDKSRIQQKIYCPVDDAIVDRSELVRGYQIEKGVYVTFTDEELEKLEAHEDHALAISEFVPLEQVDPVYFESSYHLGCSPESARAYKLLASAMTESKRVALAHFTMRNKEHLVIIRPYRRRPDAPYDVLSGRDRRPRPMSTAGRTPRPATRNSNSRSASSMT